MTTTAGTAHDVHQAPTGGGGWRGLLLRGGLLRGAWMFVAFGGLGFGLVVLARWAGGCPSGHSIVGIAQGSIASLVATVGFMLGGVVVLNLLVAILGG